MKTPEKTNDQIIAIEGVKKNFGDVTALDGVSLNIREEEFFSTCLAHQDVERPLY